MTMIVKLKYLVIISSMLLIMSKGGYCMRMPVDTLQPLKIDTLQAKPQGVGWWYSNKVIRNINLMFTDLEKYKRKVSWSDTVISVQDTLIARQNMTIETQKKDVEKARTSESQANFRADFYEKFATKQQDLTLKVLQKQNKTYLVLGVITGVLITFLITK